MTSSIYSIDENFEQRNAIEENTSKRISENRWLSKIEALLVAMAAFITNSIVAGFIATLAIYYVEFKSAFTSSNGLISLSVFLPSGIFGSAGLLTGMFLDKFGVRITAVTGGLLLAIGVGICAFATNVIFLLVFLGLFAGTGCSFVYISTSMGMYSYFRHKGRLLVPLVTLGEAFGTIIFPPLTTYFIETYFWRGSLLVISGLMLQSAVCGMMYSVKNLSQRKSKSSRKKQLKSKSPHISEGLSTSSLPTQSTSIPPNLDSTPTEQSENLHTDEPNVSSLKIPNFKNSDVNEENPKDSDDGSLCKECQELDIQDIIIENEPRENIFLGSLSNSEPETNANLDSKPKSLNRKLQRRRILVSIMKNKQFLLFLISVFIINGSILTILTDLPDFCVNQGLTLSESANSYAIGASGDALARIIGGWLLYRNKLSSLIIFTVSGISMGLLIVIYPLLSSFYLISLLSFFVLFFCGLLLSVYSVVVLDFFDINHYAIAMGISESVAGTGIVLIGYIIGLITDYNDGSYVISFYILSAMSVTCMLPILIPYLYRKRRVSIRIF